MSLTEITLPSNKSVATFDDQRRVRQSEKGLVLPVVVLQADGSPYDLNEKSLIFAEDKEGNKSIVDDGKNDTGGTFTITDAANGKFTYKLNDQCYTASGEAWFEVVDGDTIIDTTKSFYIDVIPDATIHPINDSYIASINAYKLALQGTIEKAEQSIANTTGKLDNIDKTADAQIQSAVNKATANAQSTLDATQKKYNDLLDQLSALKDSTTKSANDAIAKIGSDNADAVKKADDAIAKINTDSATAVSKANDAIAKIGTDKDAAIKNANADFDKKLSDIQADYDTWKTKTIDDFNAKAKSINDSISKSNANVDAVQKQMQDTNTRVTNLVNKFADIDFTQFAKPSDLAAYAKKDDVYAKDDTYNKSEIDTKLASAGKVKTVDNISPDDNGNIATGYGDKLKTKVTFVKCNSNQEAMEASSKPADDGSLVIGYYDPDDGDTSAVIGPNTITITSLYDSLQDLTTTVSSNSTSISSKADQTALDSLKTVVNGKVDTDTLNSVKAALEKEISNAGQVKTVNGTKPDDNGNITISIPNPDLSAYAKKADLGGYAKTSDLSNYAKTSDLSGYAKSADFYTKADLYTKAEIDAKIPKTWTGTQSEYDALSSHDANTEYYITEG